VASLLQGHLKDAMCLLLYSTFLFETNSAINDILDRENFTLEILLEEDELIQEVKSKNDVLLDL
jgi:hypothetical protein